jgi:hypothetical protein
VPKLKEAESVKDVRKKLLVVRTIVKEREIRGGGMN